MLPEMHQQRINQNVFLLNMIENGLACQFVYDAGGDVAIGQKWIQSGGRYDSSLWTG